MDQKYNLTHIFIYIDLKFKYDFSFYNYNIFFLLSINYFIWIQFLQIQKKLLVL